MKVAEARALTKSYHFGDTEVHALRGVDITIAEHEFVAVWGPSGSGKTTLCNLLGLLDDPTSGEVTIGERSAAQLADSAKSELRNASIGFVFQNFNLVPVLTALENVMLPLQIQGVSRDDARNKALSLLGEVELAERAHHR
ncbi:MAG: ATP-binding cassette domain-containing protein, partial [Verrucomicrobiae bacterium]|nr:ATP-binding cassette domain-containing protein [Verrucomicrobiae bacterium]